MKYAGNRIAFILIRIIILVAMCTMQFHFNQFLLLIVADYAFEIFFNCIKTSGTGTGNTVALENDKSYRSNLLFDYLHYNLYVLMILAVPLFFSVEFFVSQDTVKLFDDGRPLILGSGSIWVVILILFSIRFFECSIYFMRKAETALVIEEILYFDMIRIYVFALLMLFSGPILFSLEQSPPVAGYIIISLITAGDLLLFIYFNREKETVIF